MCLRLSLLLFLFVPFLSHAQTVGNEPTITVMVDGYPTPVGGCPKPTAPAEEEEEEFNGLMDRLAAVHHAVALSMPTDSATAQFIHERERWERAFEMVCGNAFLEGDQTRMNTREACQRWLITCRIQKLEKDYAELFEK